MPKERVFSEQEQQRGCSERGAAVLRLRLAAGGGAAGFGGAATVCSVTSRIGSSRTSVAPRPVPVDVAACVWRQRHAVAAEQQHRHPKSQRDAYDEREHERPHQTTSDRPRPPVIRMVPDGSGASDLFDVKHVRRLFKAGSSPRAELRERLR